MTKYPRIYAMLKARGHDACKTVEIILNASRGDRFAINWIKMARRLSHRSSSKARPSKSFTK